MQREACGRFKGSLSQRELSPSRATEGSEVNRPSNPPALARHLPLQKGGFKRACGYALNYTVCKNTPQKPQKPQKPRNRYT